MVSKLINIANKIIHSYDSNSVVSHDEFEKLLYEFNSELNKTANIQIILDVISLNQNHMRIPFDLIKEIYFRLSTLGIKNSYILRWYASMLTFYDNKFDNPEVNSLLAEADKLDGKA